MQARRPATLFKTRSDAGGQQRLVPEHDRALYFPLHHCLSRGGVAWGSSEHEPASVWACACARARGGLVVLLLLLLMAGRQVAVCVIYYRTRRPESGTKTQAQRRPTAGHVFELLIDCWPAGSSSLRTPAPHPHALARSSRARRKSPPSSTSRLAPAPPAPPPPPGQPASDVGLPASPPSKQLIGRVRRNDGWTAERGRNPARSSTCSRKPSRPAGANHRRAFEMLSNHSRRRRRRRLSAAGSPLLPSDPLLEPPRSLSSSGFLPDLERMARPLARGFFAVYAPRRVSWRPRQDGLYESRGASLALAGDAGN